MFCVNFHMGVNTIKIVSSPCSSFVTCFPFYCLLFSTKKYSLFFEKNWNTISPFFWSKNLCLCSLLCKSLLWILIFCDFKKQNKFAHSIVSKKKLLHDLLLLSCFSLNSFLFDFLFFYLFFELLCQNLLLLFVHLLFLFFCVSLFFCLFSCLVSFFCCLHTFCEHRFFRIVFFQVCLFSVFSTPCFDLSFFEK